MKTKTTLSFIVAIVFASLNLWAQVPNGGFESWTNGSPDSWYNTNISTVVTNITQATPPYSGTYGVKGEVINFSGSPYSPLLASTDQTLNGFAISQSYANFSFYYKMNITGTATFEGSLTFYDAGGNWVASSGGIFTAGTTNSYALANFPINYGSSNPPVECVIIFAINDTVAPDPPVGNYFIVDGVTLSGSVSVEEQSTENTFASAFPSPAKDFVSITLNNAINGNAELFLYDIKGSMVKKLSTEITAHNFEWQFSVADLSGGIYAVRAVSEKKQWMTKFAKE
jgi:hypothetical protein